MFRCERHVLGTGTLEDIGHIYAGNGVTPMQADVIADPTINPFEGIGAASQADGSYRIDWLPADSYTLRLGENPPEWFAGQFYNGKAAGEEADRVSVQVAKDTPNIDFVLSEGGKISGHLYDQKTGQPISAAIMHMAGESRLQFTKIMSDRTRTCLASVILGTLLVPLVACNFQSDSSTTGLKSTTSRSIPPARHRPFFQAGFAYSHIGGSYDSDLSSLELQKMRAAGCTIVQLLVFARIYRLDAPEIGMQPGYWDRILRGGMLRAKAAGLRTMIKLQLWGPGFNQGKFSADIHMTNAADWRAFLANYRLYVLHYARLAADTKADILCIGTELAQASRAPAIAGEWHALAKEARSIYSGPITYAAHHTEVEEVPFWDSLDYIGVNGYYPIAKLPAALEVLEHLSRRWNRPVIFTEAGFASSSYALTEPWRPGPYKSPRDSVRLDLQAEGWETLLTELWRRNFIWGVYVWKWHPNPTWGGSTNADHTPQGKPALDVIRRFFMKPPQRNSEVE